MLNNVYGNERINWMRKHGNLKFRSAIINAVVVETWEVFKLSPIKTTQECFNKTYIIPLSPPDKLINHKTFLADTQKPKVQKADEI